MAVYLDEILESHRQRAKQDSRNFEQLKQEAEACPSPRGFKWALERGLRGAVIAEIKRKSPSKGELRPGLNPAEFARAYESGGAACLSVLTDEQYFSGSPQDLKTAKEACSLPVLRKDFTVDVRDICDARIMGADAVLLIVSALKAGELQDFVALAEELGMDALVETHSEAELEAAAKAGASLIGVNQRDLRTFEVDRELAVRLVPNFPPNCTKVAESAIRNGHDARALFSEGYDAVLVGESFVTAPDPQAAVREFTQL